ncbi:MAG: hypothetical protein QOI66_3634 [Myxococcales bacterium]|nr:hypothetical protein [Myxococcales bacterium]
MGRPVSDTVTGHLSSDDGGSVARVTRAALLLGGTGLSVGFGLAFVLLKGDLTAYLTANVLSPRARAFLLGFGAAVSLVAVAGGGLYLWLKRREPTAATSLLHVARRLSPLCVVGFLPLLFRWQIWQSRELTFLSLVAIATLTFEVALRTCLAAGPLPVERAFCQRLLSVVPAGFRDRLPRAQSWPLWIVVACAAGYVAYFAYYTLAFHWGVHSSFDLALEDNLLWNVSHFAHEFFRSTPIFGPHGSHFSHHATFFAYVIAPFYAIHPGAGTLLFIQALLMGAAAVPLFLFVRLHLPAAAACLIAVCYLMYPPLHGANLYEFHYLPLGTFFLLTALYALESKRDRLAIVAVILTLSVREDVAAGLSIWGLYLVLTGRRPRAGLSLAILGLGYFVLMKMVLMPLYGHGESFTDMFKGLIPQGENSFGGVLKTVVGNPAYTLATLLDQGKLIYLLLLLVPLAFLPVRSPLALLFVLPGFLFTLLSTGYGPLINIHFQYTANWTVYLFVSMALALRKYDSYKLTAALGALTVAILATSYQYGAILQHNTSYGGGIPYHFGVNDVDRQRRQSMDAILKVLPPRAKVVGSGFVIPQVSSRPDAYTMTIGVFDGDYLVFPTEPQDFIVNERQTVTSLLSNNTFGVVLVQPPFALARRGYSTDQNQSLLSRWR